MRIEFNPVTDTSTPNYERWVKAQSHGYWCCVPCEFECNSDIIGMMFDLNDILITPKGAYLCPICRFRLLQWWTKSEGAVFFE